jgi:phosphoribosylglycinamide formyltransferase 1
MRLAIFTSNALRHKYLANTLAALVQDCMVVVEAKPGDGVEQSPEADTLAKHFAGRYAEEVRYFRGNDLLHRSSLPVLHGEVNSGVVLDAIDGFQPDAAVVFGASIIREPLLSRISVGRFINLHLGLSPYYRGSGTNFWPFVNRELQYVGATLLHIDAGIDTGDIIAHVRPEFTPDDTVHSAGCKTIRDGVMAIADCLRIVEAGRPLSRVRQWKDAACDRFYRKRDVTEATVIEYQRNIDAGVVKDYLEAENPPIRLVALA